MRYDGGDVSHHILGLDRLPIDFRKVSQKCRLDIGLRGCAVEPERIRAPSAAVVVMLVRDETGKCECWTACR